MAFQILFVGDIHLGRSPRLLYDDCDVANDPASAWHECVRIAIENDVKAVVLAGDVVDSTHQVLSSISPFEDGLRQLTDHGIAALAVAGNHDGNALGRLQGHDADFHYLGRGGEWESVCIGEVDGVPVNVVGWSFPQEKVKTSPLADLDSAVLSDGISLGVLHCDRGATDGYYAPVAAREFNEGPPGTLDAWFLGHIHQPDTLQGSRPVGYLGSVAPLRRKDLGPRGPWLVTVNGQSDVDCQQIPINSVLYAAIRCDLAGMERDVHEDTQIEDVILQRVRDQVEALQFHDGARAIGVRLQIHGRVSSYDEVQAALRDWRKWGSRTMDSIREWCVVKVTDDTCPEVDLEALGSDDGCLSGLLAAEMGAIVSRDEESMGSLRNAARAVIRQYDGCDLPDLNDEDLQAIARDVGYDILMKLMVDSGEDSQ